MTRMKVWRPGLCGVCLKKNVNCSGCLDQYCRVDLSWHHERCRFFKKRNRKGRHD